MGAMIEVENLTKWYGSTLALDRVTFEVHEGQIVGFLGPNGAGKSTTLRILTGFMPATTGRAAINGHDAFTDSLALRRSIGYMPESVPLYPEMRVSEYLAFRAALKGVRGKERRKEVDRVIGRCWLKDVRRRLVGQLSKGYRQRVGLADALIGDPPALILDEPTIGLDPTQMQEVRRLVTSLGEKHTLLLSSHILPEVERVCTHLVIIARGRIAAAGSVEELRRGLAARHRVVLETRSDSDGPAEMARAVGGARGVASVERVDLEDGWQRLTASPEGDADPREALAAVAGQRGWAVRELHRVVPTIEDLYLAITAGEGRPGESESAAA